MADGTEVGGNNGPQAGRVTSSASTGDEVSERERYPAGVPCWVETLQPDPHDALDFYGPLFEWEFVRREPMLGDPSSQYFVARVRGRDVAGVGSLPDRSSPPTRPGSVAP